MAIAVINCGKNENAVTFNDICQENDQADVQLSGFLVYPQSTPNFTNQSFLLVENKNGTGGFIKLQLAETPISNSPKEVKILGKVLKDEKGCVLNVEKIETP